MPDPPTLGWRGPRLALAEKQSYDAFEAELRSKLPHLAARLDALDVKDRTDFGQVLATRNAAWTFIEAHPEVSGPIELDCAAVEVLSPSVAFELLRAWPEAMFINTNDDVREAVEIVRERLGR